MLAAVALNYPPERMCACDIDNVVAGHIAAAELGQTGERYILGGENLPFRDLMAVANEVVGHADQRLWPLSRTLIRLSLPAVSALEWLPLQGLYLARDYFVLADKFLYFSSDKAIRELDYPQTPFRTSLERSYAWYREQGVLERSNTRPNGQRFRCGRGFRKVQRPQEMLLRMRAAATWKSPLKWQLYDRSCAIKPGSLKPLSLLTRYFGSALGACCT